VGIAKRCQSRISSGRILAHNHPSGDANSFSFEANGLL
jgi:DNA repair protein RadC